MTNDETRLLVRRFYEVLWNSCDDDVDDRARNNLDRHASCIVTAFIAGVS